MGHARALLSLADEADQRRIARDVIARSLSVRETEALVKKIVDAGKPAREAAEPKPADVHTRAAEDRLKLLLGTRVRIVRQGTRGRIEIDFVSEDELIRIYDQLTDDDAGGRTVAVGAASLRPRALPDRPALQEGGTKWPSV